MSDPTDDYLQRYRLVRAALGKVKLGGLETRFEQTIDDDFDDSDFVDVSEYLRKEGISAPPAQPAETRAVQIFSTIPPDYVGFYEKNKKVGELYFKEDPMRVVELDQSFKQYADELKKILGI